MTEDRTAGQTSRYDQTLAAADAEIGQLTGILQARSAAAGEPQALVDIRALVDGKDTAELAGLLLAALRRLAGHGGQAS
jgi:hypothetical protein